VQRTSQDFSGYFIDEVSAPYPDWSQTMKTRFLPFIFILIILFGLPSPARADGIIIPEPPICDPGPCPPLPLPISQLEIRYHHVDVRIEDQVAVTHVDQVFFNPNDWTVEGTYVFPIPYGATVTNFILWIDGQAVEGQVLEADEARRTYEEIVRQMQDPALLEYADRGALQARIFPIPPQGERRIELEYTQVLTAEGGLVRYTYPLNTEKFSTQPLKSVRISLDVRSNVPVRAVYSPSHPVAVSKDGSFHFTAGYEATDIKPDTDFALYYSIGEGEAFHLLSYRDPADPAEPDGFFALLLAPRPEAAVHTLPKDVILVLDRSGSMEGDKFSQAQDALVYILEHLNPEDRFNIITFSTGIETYAQTVRDTSEVQDAIDWVQRLSAVGSTDINRALLEAAAYAQWERPTYLIFLTDGLPTEGVVDSSQILNNLASTASDNLRLFAFGVGYDVDTYLLDSLAAEHHGTSTYVVPGESIDEVLSSFYAKVSTPVLTDLELDFGDMVVYDLYPSPLPDLFEGSQIVVVGRYREGGVTDVTLRGNLDRQTQTFTFPDQVFISDSLGQAAGGANQAFLSRLWATRKIGYLLNQVRLQGAEQELIDQIVRLSIRYGIVTPYTSYLVTEPSPLGAAEQGRIAEEQFMALEAAPAAPSYGQDAVEKAARQGDMAQSESAEAPMESAAEIVRVVGSHTFVLSQGVWTDTAFDPDRMVPLRVAFLSQDYFALSQARPEMAAAFALGGQVIVVFQGVAYQVVPADAPADPVTVPPTPAREQLLETVPLPTTTPETGTSQSNPTPTAEAATPRAGNPLPCLGAALPLLVIPPAFILVRSRRGSQKS
jgi:Ca-activated chloride channel family protein